MTIQYEQISIGIPVPVNRASNAASSNCASLKVEKLAVRPCIVAMKRCWLTIMSASFAELDFSDKVQRHFRFAPHHVEWIVPQDKVLIDGAHSEASEGQITRLNRGAKARPHEIDRVCDRLRPDGSHCSRGVNFRLACDEAVLLDQVARKLGETITFIVTVKVPAKHIPPVWRGVCGIPAYAVLQADVHHPAGL